jgi:hypothetical protein
MHVFQQRVLKQIYLEHSKFYPTKIDPKMIRRFVQFAIKSKEIFKLNLVLSLDFTWLRDVNWTTATRKSTLESVLPIAGSVFCEKKKKQQGCRTEWIIATEIVLVYFIRQSEEKVSKVSLSSGL